MPAACIRHTELPHTSRLYKDYLYNFDRVSSFYEHAPLEPDSLRQAAQQVQFSAAQRNGLVAALRQQNGDTPALRRLAEPGTVAVVTGQQVGLFGGPAYTVYKALTASALARQLTSQGIPAVAVFWLATEDHDLAEVDHCWVFGKPQQPVRLNAQAHGAQQPVGGIVMNGVPLQELRSTLEELPFGAAVTDLVESCYQPGRQLGEAFADLLRRLMAGHDLLLLDPLQPAVRQLAAPVLRTAVEQAPLLTQALLQRNRDLEQNGYHAQVHVEPTTSLVFRLEGHNGQQRRIALRRQDGEYTAKDRRHTAGELAQEAQWLSPNALLRPVVQDSILPTVAYVGGPAELAYFAQSQVLYQHLLGRMPVMLPRSGFTLYDARTAKLLQRYGLSLANFYHGEEALREAMALRLSPPAVAERIADTRQQLARMLNGLNGEVTRFDPTLAAALQNSRGKMEWQLAKIEAKIARETMRRDMRAQADAASLYGLLFPHKTLQERVYSILPFLASWGPDVISRVGQHMHLDCPDHILAEV